MIYIEWISVTEQAFEDVVTKHGIKCVYLRLRVDMLIKVGWIHLFIIALVDVFLTIVSMYRGILAAWGLP